MTKWVVCLSGKGFSYKDGKKDSFQTHFPRNSIAKVKQEENDFAIVWLVGDDSEWIVKIDDTRPLDVSKTGDKFSEKICNICHCLKPVEEFDKNQNNLHGVVRRPSCRKCRTNIDKRAPKTRQAKDMEKKRPTKGSFFQCPICRKRSIVGITAKIVADHDHHTGNIRDFICDSCNTGLGRFKNGQNYLMNAHNYIQQRETFD